MQRKEKEEVICNATKDDAAKVVTRLGGLEVCDPIETPGFTADENREDGFVGIRHRKRYDQDGRDCLHN